jgi:hypothetical protein
MAGIDAVRVVRIRISDEAERSGAAEGEAERAGALQVPQNSYCRGPVLRPVAIKESGEPSNSEGNVGTGGHSNVV